MDDLTGPQSLAIAALTRGASYTEAAEAAGCSRSTLWSWRTGSVAFRCCLAQTRAEALDDAGQALASAARAAVRVLLEVAESPNAAPAERVKAACAILDRMHTAEGVPTEEADPEAAALAQSERESAWSNRQQQADLAALLR